MLIAMAPHTVSIEPADIYSFLGASLVVALGIWLGERLSRLGGKHRKK